MAHNLKFHSPLPQLKDIQVKGFENYAECVNVMFLQKRNLYKKAMFQAFTVFSLSILFLLQFIELFQLYISLETL